MDKIAVETADSGGGEDGVKNNLRTLMIDASDIQETSPRRDQLQAAAHAVANIIPDHKGFILLVAPYGNGESNDRAEYVSNVNREDAIKILKTLLFRWGQNEEWMR